MTVIYKVNGKVVSLKEFRKSGKRATFAPGIAPAVHGMAWRAHKPPLTSEALAVHPIDAVQAEVNARKAGFNVRFGSDGRPEFTSLRQKEAYARSQGMHFLRRNKSTTNYGKRKTRIDRRRTRRQ